MKIPRKVLFVSDDLLNGGAQRQLALLASNLSSDWEVLVWSLTDGPHRRSLEDNGVLVQVDERKYVFDLRPFLQLQKVIHLWKPDIIHSWGWLSTLATLPIAKLLSTPFVNGIIRSAKPYYYRGRISLFLSRFGNVVISNSKIGLQNWGIPPGRGKVVYNGFDTKRIKNFHQTKANGIFNVIMAGRMVKAKDFDSFMLCTRETSLRGIKGFHFIALGSGEEKQQLMEQNSDLIAKGIVEFPEPCIEIIDYLQQCQVGILLTKPEVHEEGCSNSLMEYMASGLPVIATDSGGNPELVINGVTGYLIKDNNIDEILERLVWLRENSNESVLMGKNGRDRILSEFSVEKMVCEFEAVYSELIKHNYE